MKKLIIITTCILLISCNKRLEKSKEIENLLERISLLEKQNNKLKDSISQSERDYLNSTFLIGIPYNQILKVGKKDSINMLLHSSLKKIPKYEIYRIEDKKEVKIGENDNSKFTFDFTPKSVKDNNPKLLLKIPSEGNIIKIQCELMLKVEK